MLNIFQQGQLGRRRVGGAAGAAVTFDPAKTSTRWTLSNGNLTATSNNTSPPSAHCSLGTLSKSTGAHYFEFRLDTQVVAGFYGPAMGVAQSSINIESHFLGASGGLSYALGASNGDKRFQGTASGYGSPITPGDIVMVALNLTTGKIWWGENGTWFASGNPAADTNPAFSSVAAGPWFPVICYNASTIAVTARFKAADFTYSPPSGFSAWEP